MTVVRINANVQWKFFRAKGGNWVAVCEPLSLTVQSDTWAHLMEDIAETLNGILADLRGTHELERFLRERGWEPVGILPSTPDEDVWFDIPINIIQTNRDSQVPLHQ